MAYHFVPNRYASSCPALDAGGRYPMIMCVVFQSGEIGHCGVTQISQNTGPKAQCQCSVSQDRDAMEQVNSFEFGIIVIQGLTLKQRNLSQLPLVSHIGETQQSVVHGLCVCGSHVLRSRATYRWLKSPFACRPGQMAASCLVICTSFIATPNLRQQKGHPPLLRVSLSSMFLNRNDQTS